MGYDVDPTSQEHSSVPLLNAHRYKLKNELAALENSRTTPPTPTKREMNNTKQGNEEVVCMGFIEDEANKQRENSGLRLRRRR